MKIKVECRLCHTVKELEVDEQAYTNWKNGMLIQRAFPTMSMDDRELLISKTCGKCWNEIFGEEE